MKIRKKVLQKIAESNRVRALLALTCDKSLYTIQKWVLENDENLTKASALKVIREELGLTDDQILEETKNKVA